MELEENKSGWSTPQSSAGASLKKSDSKSNLKKDKSVGDIFKSFAKAKPKAKEAEKAKELAEDGMFISPITVRLLIRVEPMQGMSEDEGDEDDGPEVEFDKEKAAAVKKAREEREQKLQQMMEADGWSGLIPLVYKLTLTVEMPDAAPEEDNDSQDAPLDTGAQSKPDEGEDQDTVTVQGDRRRGRRRVMKKKKVVDEDGYLGKPTAPSYLSMHLTLDSHKGRSGLGVLLGRRAAAQESQTGTKGR